MAALQDGFRTLVTFPLDPFISLWEKRVTPHGFDGGGGISTSTMRTNFLHSMTPKSLTKVTDMTIVCAWNPVVYSEIYFILQEIMEASTTFPDGSILRVYSFIDKFIPSEMVEGEQPTASVTVIAANTDGPPNYTETTVTYVAP